MYVFSFPGILCLAYTCLLKCTLHQQVMHSDCVAMMSLLVYCGLLLGKLPKFILTRNNESLGMLRITKRFCPLCEYFYSLFRQSIQQAIMGPLCSGHPWGMTRGGRTRLTFAQQVANEGTLSRCGLITCTILTGPQLFYWPHLAPFSLLRSKCLPRSLASPASSVV